MQRIKEHLDKIIALVIVAACLTTLLVTLVTGNEQAVSAQEIEGDVQQVGHALGANPSGEVPELAYADTFVTNMNRADRHLPQDLVAWRFSPQPPFVKDFEIATEQTYPAKLSSPSMRVDGVWVGRGSIRVFFGKDEYCLAKALLIYRKALADPEWPSEPIMVLKAGDALPPGVRSAPDGYEIAVQNLQPHVPYLYRACTAAAFHAKVKTGSGARGPDGTVVLPEDKNNFLAPSDAARPVLTKLLVGDTDGTAVLAGSPFLSQFSDTVKIELPGDVQIRLTMMEQDEAGKYVRAAFAMKRWVQSLDKWVEKSERVDIGQPIKSEAFATVDNKRVKCAIDTNLVLDELKVEMRNPPPIIRKVPKLDPKTGKPVVPSEMIDEEWVGPPRRVQLAIVRDQTSGQKHELIAGPDQWWPKDLLLAPKNIDLLGPPSQGAGTVSKAVMSESAHAPTAPTTVPNNAGQPSAVEEDGRPGSESGQEGAPVTVSVDPNGPPPPADAPAELREAYERARSALEARNRRGGAR